MNLKRKRIIWLLSFLFSATALLAQPRPAPPPSKAPGSEASGRSAARGPLAKSLEDYLRRAYAWGPSFQVKVGPIKNSAAPGLLEVNVQVTMGDQSNSAVFYVTKDGRYLLRGDLQDMTADPLSAVRSQIHLENSPSKGPQNARVVVVEYADFQCPSCKQLFQTLRAIEPNYPQVRFVFKDFPLTQIHPWAMTAAIAGRCAFRQKPEAFWALHDSIFENQETMSTANVWQKLLEFGASAGLDIEGLRACMSTPEPEQEIAQSIREGQTLKIGNTPTVFVNGRRMIGTDRALLEQYILYELAASPSHTTPATVLPRR